MGFYLRVSAVQWLLFRVEARGHDCRRPYCLSHAARVWELEMACFEILKRSGFEHFFFVRHYFLGKNRGAIAILCGAIFMSQGPRCCCVFEYECSERPGR